MGPENENAISEIQIRPLITDDMYILSEILDKMEIDLDVKGEEAREVGLKLIYNMVRKVYKARKEVTLFLAQISGRSVQEISELPMGQTIDLFKQALSQDGLIDFFTVRKK